MREPLFTVYLVWLHYEGRRVLHNVYASKEKAQEAATDGSAYVQSVPVYE